MLTQPDVRWGVAQQWATPFLSGPGAKAVGLMGWMLLCVWALYQRADLPVPFLCLTLVAAPIVEEIFFRGALWEWGQRLLSLKGASLNLVISGLFAMAHLQFTAISELSGHAQLHWGLGFLGISLTLGFTRARAGLGAAIVVHSAFNALYLTFLGDLVDQVMTP